MLVKIVAYFFLISNTQCRYYNSKTSILRTPFEYDDYFWVNTKIEPIKRSFSERIKNDMENSRKLDLFDMAYSSNVTYVDNIPHYRMTKNNPKWKKINMIENEYRNLLGMKGLTYVYKRDSKWRTWREIKHNSKNKNGSEVLFYVSVNNEPADCEDCNHSGIWSLEDGPPPCPYEIFSQAAAGWLCAARAAQWARLAAAGACPSRVAYAELGGACRNPLRTRWRLARRYSPPDREAYFCGARAACDLVTLYQMSSEQIVFRIVNSTNHIIYSRVMKPANHTFSCVDDCGHIDLKTYQVTKSDAPVSVNLFTNKTKRENKLEVHPFRTNPSLDLKPERIAKRTKNVSIFKPRRIFHVQPNYVTEMDIDVGRGQEIVKATTSTTCDKLARKWKAKRDEESWEEIFIARD